MSDAPLARGERESLPSRRAGYNQKSRIGGTVIHLRTGEYPDGRLGEIFLDVAKAGSSLRAMMCAFSRSVSIGLQHGVPLEEYIDAFRGFSFTPCGQVQGDPRCSQADSILDYVVRELGATYLDRPELLQQPKVPVASGVVL